MFYVLLRLCNSDILPEIVIFPIRGHSYLECDRDLSLINQKSCVEVPEELREVIRNSHTKQSSFIVTDYKQEMFKAWTNFLKPMYQMKCPLSTRPIRCLNVDSSSPSLVHHLSSYSSHEVTINPPSIATDLREAHTTLHSLPYHPYTVLNPHILNSFLTHSALSNPHTQLHPCH